MFRLIKSLTMNEKEKYEFCLKVIEIENKRNEKIEDKAKFLFSIISIVITGIILEIDTFSILFKRVNIENSSTLNFLIISLLSASILMLILMIVCVFGVMRIHELKSFCPKNPLSSLYSPSSQFLKTNEEKDFHNAIGEHLCIVIENNSKLINAKSKRVNYGWYSLFILFALLIIQYLIISL